MTPDQLDLLSDMIANKLFAMVVIFPSPDVLLLKSAPVSPNWIISYPLYCEV